MGRARRCWANTLQNTSISEMLGQNDLSSPRTHNPRARAYQEPRNPDLQKKHGKEETLG